MIWKTALLGVIYTGLGALFVKSALQRRSAVRLWREANGGPFDLKQRLFITEQELERAKLPPESARMLGLARRDLGFAMTLLMAALIIQNVTLGE
ncbi:MAG: hypothetical protein KGS44_15550 [Alphaproteobacteria bacterium]|jgi:hypothetical protein|nr:hypothetical protein [Alphaproteobacteria bacterium]